MTETAHPLRSYRESKSLTLAQVGRLFGVHKTTVLRWEENGVPAERVIEIETKTRIARQRLRPDLYPSRMAAAS